MRQNEYSSTNNYARSKKIYLVLFSVFILAKNGFIVNTIKKFTYLPSTPSTRADAYRRFQFHA